MPKLNDYLSIGEAAEYLCVSKDTLRRWDRSGKLTARRHPVTQFRLYPKEDLDALLGGIARPTDTGRRSRKSSKSAGKGGR